MRDKVLSQTKTIQSLKRGIEDMRHVRVQEGDQSSLIKARSQADFKLFEAKQALSTLEAEAQVNDGFFSRNKEYHQTLLTQYRDLQDKRAELERHYREKDAQGERVDYLKEQITEARKEKNKLQEKYDALARTPFFKKEADNTNYKRLEDLKASQAKIQRETDKARASLLQQQKEIKELEKEQRELEYDRDFHNKELRRISTVMDPNGISPEVVLARLRAEDNNAYRKMMQDLKLDGDEPEWEKQELLDSIKKDLNPDQPEKVKLQQDYKQQLERKKDIILRLRNVEEILRNDVEMDRATREESERNISILKTQIQQDTNRVEQCNKLLLQRQATIKDLQAQLPKNEALLTAANLRKQGLDKGGRHIEDDDFSVMTEESDLQFMENVMDLRVSKIQLQPNLVNEILGMRDPLDSAVQTFMTLDFFNHDTKHTEMSTGYEPDIDTIFSFKNNVDGFYLKYLQREHILAELFMVRGVGGAGKRSVKIAEAKLPLSPLLSG